jgi:hypothetical protein
MGPGFNAPIFGTWTLPKTGDRLGAYAVGLDRVLRPVLASGDVREVVYEAPIVSTSNGQSSNRKQHGLGFFTEYLCEIHGIRCREKAVSSVRKHFLGVGKAPKWVTDGKPKGAGSKWFKEQTMKRCAQLGWHVETHDEADALALLDYVITTDRGAEFLRRASE